jgi:glycosyltransferase involved in cell wall biosynthesis
MTEAARDRLAVWLPALRVGTGSDVFVERLADGLRHAGHRVEVSWFSRRYEFAPWLLSHVPAPEGTQVIHANAAQAFAFARPGLPLVATELHYVLDPAYRPFKSMAQALYHRALIGRFLARSFRAATVVTAISRSTAHAVECSGNGPAAVRVTPLWVALDRFHPAAVTVARPAGPLRLLFVGNASRRKGADVVPALAARLGDAVEIVCTSGLREAFARGMPPNVRVLGRLDEAGLIAQYQACGAALVPSRYEGFGYAALEAMACGKPVVGFRSDAIAEVVGHDAGLLVGVDDVDGLADACRALASDSEMAARLGCAGRARAEQHYSERAGVRAFEDAYRETLGK